MPADEPSSTIVLVTQLTVAWLQNPNVRPSAEDVPVFLRTMHEAIESLSATGAARRKKAFPDEGTVHRRMVTINKSLESDEYLLSMINGKPYKTLRRHLAANGLTPDQYRERYNLNPDYPVVAPAYAAMRRAIAMKIGLGIENRPHAPAKKPRR